MRWIYKNNIFLFFKMVNIFIVLGFCFLVVNCLRILSIHSLYPWFFNILLFWKSVRCMIRSIVNKNTTEYNKYLFKKRMTLFHKNSIVYTLYLLCKRTDLLTNLYVQKTHCSQNYELSTSRNISWNTRSVVELKTKTSTLLII